MKINLVKNAAKRLYLKSRRAATYKNSNNLLARRAIHDIEIWKVNTSYLLFRNVP